MNPSHPLDKKIYLEAREKQWECLFKILGEVNDEEANSFSLNSPGFTSSINCGTSSMSVIFSGDEDPKCFYYKVNDDPATAKPLQFNHTLEDCYKMNRCYLLNEFSDMMMSISKTDNAKIQMLVASYIYKADVQTAIDNLEYYCSKLYFILFYDIWLKKTHENETIQQWHKKFTMNLLDELKDEVKNSQYFIDYIKLVHFAFTVTERIVQKLKKMERRIKK